jgi:large subunit ribosomal protein L25
MKTITISGQARTGLGKRATKADRNSGNIPCVLYAGNEVVHFTSSLSNLRGIIYTPHFFKALVDIDGTVHEALLKDVQVHPVTEALLHVDFQKLIPGNPVLVDIPVHVVGVAEGVREGGKLLIKVRKLRVRSTPENLKGSIDVDVSNLKLGQSVKIRDINEEGFEILNSESIPVASVEIPRVLKSATAEAAKTAAPAAATPAAAGAKAPAAPAKKDDKKK